jgi:uncharacterized protein with HEPN domain
MAADYCIANILVHEYFGLNLDQIWTMTQKDLPDLEERIRNIHAGTAGDPPYGA